MTEQELREQFAALRTQGRRHRDAALQLGVSEGEAIAAHQGEHGERLAATALQGPWVELLQGLEACGPVLALTRNESTVHEKVGIYQNISGGAQMGLALGEQIDLRLFFTHWHAGFLVNEAPASQGEASLSLQFFDKGGQAVHKVFAREGTDRQALAALAHRFAAPAGAPIAFEAAVAPAAPRPDDAVDAEGLARAWAAMEDTHEFFGLLKKFEVERQQSFRLTEGEFTHCLPNGTVSALLNEAAFDGTPIMVFVGSRGCIQIHSGPVTRVEPMEMRGMRWINVLDAGFNLHLREDMIERVWVVQKPTRDGVVTSVEAFDGEGTLMAMFFGVRKPGQPEREDWRALVARLPRAPEALQ